MYDEDNVYPQRVRNAIHSSGTASACTNLMAKHLRGRGYRNQDLEYLVINEKNETIGDVHKLLCNDRAMYLGYAFIVQYNALFQPQRIVHVPFESVRLSLPDDRGNVLTAKLHPDWARESGKNFEKKLITEVDLYTNDIEKIYEQIEWSGGFDNWNGHLIYFSERGNCVYPPAVCDPVFEDLLTDAGIKMWKFRGISTDFMASYFWMFQGEFADDYERQAYADSINSFQGVDSSHKILLVECPLPNTKPELVKVDKQDNDRVYELTEVTCRENIIRNYGQPLTLHAIKTAGQLGLTKEWEEAKANYDERTSDEREKVALSLKPFVVDWSFGNPVTDDDFTIIPLTGLSEEKEVKSLSEVLEVGKITAIQMILSDQVMSLPQKINFLVGIYGIELNLAEAIVNGTTLPNEYK